MQLRFFVRRFFSQASIDFIKSMLGRKTKYAVGVEFKYGDLDRFLLDNAGGSYGLTKATVQELMLIEEILIQFNEIKLSYVNPGYLDQ